MRIRPIAIFYLLVILVFLFDAAMWMRYKQVSQLADRQATQYSRLAHMYAAAFVSPFAPHVRYQSKLTRQQINEREKPWPLPDYLWNQLVLRSLFWVIIPVLLLYLIWLDYRQHRKVKPPSERHIL